MRFAFHEDKVGMVLWPEDSAEEVLILYLLKLLRDGGELHIRTTEGFCARADVPAHIIKEEAMEKIDKALSFFEEMKNDQHDHTSDGS